MPGVAAVWCASIEIRLNHRVADDSAVPCCSHPTEAGRRRACEFNFTACRRGNRAAGALSALAESSRGTTLAGIEISYVHVKEMHGADVPNWPLLNRSDCFGVSWSEALGLSTEERLVSLSACG